MKNKFLRSMFALVLVLMSGILLSACGTKDFDASKIQVGSTTFTYDGTSHVFEVDYEVEKVDVTVTYSTTNTGEFKAASELSFVNADTYNVYYKISAEGFNDYVSTEPVEFTINPAVVTVSTINELNTAITNKADGNYVIKLNSDFDLKTDNNNDALRIQSGEVTLDS